MGFGAFLASDGQLLDAKLMALVTEVRVEQTLDEPTKFAVRFADDWCEGKELVRGDARLALGKVLSVAVQPGQDLVCLVEGPIEDDESLQTVGGPGSWHQISGRDLRARLEAGVVKASYEGRASGIVEAILTHYGFSRFDIQQSEQIYSAKTTALTQAATDLAFVTQQARDNGFAVWLETRCALDGERLRIGGADRVVHFRASPRREHKEATLAQARSENTLVVQNKDDRCVNVSQWKVERDSKRAAKVSGAALEDKSGKIERIEAHGDRPAMERNGRVLARIGSAVREIDVVTPGGPDEKNTRAKAALDEERFFVKATFSTTAHMLGYVLAPHDLVEVIHTSEEHCGPYQVKAVTHVINAADHFMDVELRRDFERERTHGP
jgi:hypothetical protein